MAWFIFNQSITLNALSFYAAATLFSAPSYESLVNFTRCHGAKKIDSIFSSENAPALLLTMFYISNICYSSAATL